MRGSPIDTSITTGTRKKYVDLDALLSKKIIAQVNNNWFDNMFHDYYKNFLVREVECK